MSRKDFEVIAETIQRLNVSPSTRTEIALEFASTLGATNDRFNKDRFLRACAPGANVRAR